MTPAMAPATETGLEAEATLSTSQGGWPSPVTVRKPSSTAFSVDALDRADPETLESGQGAASLSERTARRSEVFRSGPFPARFGVEREHVPGADVDHYQVAVRDSAAEQLLGELVLDPARDHATQRAGTVDPIVALLGEKVLGCVCDLDRHLQLNQTLAEPLQLTIDDLPDLPRRQALEDHHGIDTVEELRAKHPLQLFVDFFLGVLVAPLDLIRLVDNRRLETERRPSLVDIADAQVRGHDDHGVREVDGLALRVAEPPILEDLQEHVEDIGMRLLDLSEKDHRVRPPAHGFRELTALVVADVPRR